MYPTSRRIVLITTFLFILIAPLQAQENVDQEAAKKQHASATATTSGPGQPLRPLMRNGKPFFPIGSLNFPMLKMHHKHGSWDAKILRAIGWNTVLAVGASEGKDQSKMRDQLDRFHREGMAVILNLAPYVGKLCKEGMGPEGWAKNPEVKEQLKQRLGKVIDAVKDHPAILGYYTFDEPENHFYRHPLFKQQREAQQEAGQAPNLGQFISSQVGWVKQTIRKHDSNPEHYVFAVIAWWDHYDKLSEAVVDVNLPNQYSTAKGVGEFGGVSDQILYDAHQAAAAARAYNGLGYVYMPFGCNYIGKPWRAPTQREFRYSVFAPMTEGAMGCVYWAAYRSRGPFVPQTILPVLSELAEFVPYWLGQWHDEALTLEPNLKIVRDRYEVPALSGCVRKAPDGSFLVLVVNNLERPIHALVKLDLPNLPPTAHDSLRADTPIAIENKTLELPMGPLGVSAVVIKPSRTD
jgi:hypothetical protein